VRCSGVVVVPDGLFTVATGATDARAVVSPSFARRSRRLRDLVPLGVCPAPGLSHGFTALPSATGVDFTAVSPTSAAARHGFGGGGVAIPIPKFPSTIESASSRPRARVASP
jgi:hypothetical protein